MKGETGGKKKLGKILYKLQTFPASNDVTLVSAKSTIEGVRVYFKILPRICADGLRKKTKKSLAQDNGKH
jgi:hypothetical protein